MLGRKNAFGRMPEAIDYVSFCGEFPIKSRLSGINCHDGWAGARTLRDY